MGCVWITLCFLQVLVVVSYGYEIEKSCERLQNLNFEVIGYKCSFKGHGIYTYNALTQINYIEFDRLIEDSYVYVLNNNVQRIIIQQGTMNICNNILPPKTNVIINGMTCPTMFSSSQDSSSIILTDSFSSMATWTSTSISALATSPLYTTALVTSSYFIVASTATSTSSPTCVPSHIEDRQDKDQIVWILGLTASLLATVAFTIWEIAKCIKKRKRRPYRGQTRQLAFSERMEMMRARKMKSSIEVSGDDEDSFNSCQDAEKRTEILIVVMLSLMVAVLKCYRWVEWIFNVLDEDPQGQLMQPPGQPIQPQVQPIQPQAQPIQPQGQPMQPQAQPIQPQAQPIQPQGQLIQPQAQPIQPQAQPIQPQGQPIQPQAQPIQPQGQLLQRLEQQIQPQQLRRSQRIRNCVNRLNL